MECIASLLDEERNCTDGLPGWSSSLSRCRCSFFFFFFFCKPLLAESAFFRHLKRWEDSLVSLSSFPLRFFLSFLSLLCCLSIVERRFRMRLWASLRSHNNNSLHFDESSQRFSLSSSFSSLLLISSSSASLSLLQLSPCRKKERKEFKSVGEADGSFFVESVDI